MNYSHDQAAAVLKMVENCMAKDEPADEKLRHIWWTLLFIRARALAKDLRPYINNKVAGGPFKGMRLTEESIAKYQGPVMLGCYEQELHPIIEEIIATGYNRILNIGCSIGYYAVGFARRMPHATIEAFDILPVAQKKCQDMANLNEVENRLKIAGQFYGEDFAKYIDGKTLIFTDVEGSELELLDPDRYPALKKMNILVELHDLMNPIISKTVSDRFRSTHDITIIQNRNILPDLTPVLGPNFNIDPFDQLLMGWEARDGSTPWGYYKSKTP